MTVALSSFQVFIGFQYGLLFRMRGLFIMFFIFNICDLVIEA
jgi:hypothetical protein